MKKIGLINIFILVFLTGCLGGQSKKTKSPDCAQGQDFDAVSRSCQGAIITSRPPTPTLSALSMLEDAGATNVILSYTDINNDLAFSCTISSLSTDLYTVLPNCICSGGVCSIVLTPDTNFNGTGDFFYSVEDNDGVSANQYVAVTVASLNDVPVVTNASLTVDEDATLPSIDLTTVAGVVSVAASFDDTQGGAPNESNTPLEYSILTGASNGTASINSSTGFLSYSPTPNHELASGDSIIIGVRDSVMAATGASFVPVSVIISAGVLNADAPLATTTSYTTTLIEDTAFTFNTGNGQLAGTELDSSDYGATTFECSINPNTSHVFQTGTCSCVMNLVTGLALCDVAVLPKQNIDSGDNPKIEYTFDDVTNSLTSTSSTFNLAMTNTDDSPVAFSTINGGNGHVSIIEPIGPAPAAVTSFTVDPSWDESVVTLSYAITTAPTSGTLSNCMNNNNDLTCDYIATSGNLQNTAMVTAASLVLGDLTLNALTMGSNGDNIDVTIIGAPNIGTNPQIIVDPANNQDLTIYIDIDGVSTLPVHVGNAIAAHDLAKKIVLPVIGGATPVSAVASTPLAGGVDGYADSFTYQVEDAAGNTNSNTVFISITGTNDRPVMCNYSGYSDLNNCGGLGCIGTSNPTDLNIVPTTHTASKPIIFFNKAEGVCWKSTSTALWAIIDNGTDPSHIQDILVNEGEGVIIVENFGVDEGGSGAENADSLRITSVVSDNEVLIPSGNIIFYFNNTELTVGALFGGVASEGDSDFRMQVVPQVGNIGTANITVTLADTPGATSSFTFKVEVQGFSAIHNGWKNISAIGPKFNKFNQLIDSNKNVCSYNLDKCNGGQECTAATVGQADPNGSVTADAANSIYYNATNNKCYLAVTAGTAWSELVSYCAVTPANLNPGCSGASCIGTVAPTYNALSLNEFYYDRATGPTGTCYRSVATGTGAADWSTYNATTEVTIEWENFSPVPAVQSITSYEVYRRLANDRFDYTQKLNRVTIDDLVTTFVDNAVNSTFPPIPETVYYYEIRPVIQGVSTNTDEVFKTLRLTSPPENMVFTHRWMVNKTMCELMSSATIDPNNNYRCSYEGPGDTGVTIGSNFYDIGKDMLVDRFEAGCNFNSAPTCSGTSDGACIGINDPTTDTIDGGADGVIYYARSSGSCYVSSGGGTTWNIITGDTVIPDYVKSGLPPLVNISQTNAHNFCSSENVQSILGLTQGNAATTSSCDYSRGLCSGADCTGGADPNGVITGISGALYFDSVNNNCLYNVNGATAWAMTGCSISKGSCSGANCVGIPNAGTVTAKAGSIYYDTDDGTCHVNTDGATTWTTISLGLAKALPTRKEQMAYALWDTANNTDAAITTIETGLSLNSSAKCNSSSANGLSANYSDVSVPDSNTYYSLPGTDTSNIRSMITGSEETNSCVSRFGVQDHVGNVAEWTTERFSCRSSCAFSTTACDTGNNQCTDTSDPYGTVTAQKGSYFLNTASSICFINTDSATAWKPAHCAYSDTACDGGAICTGAVTPNGAVASNEGQLYWDSVGEVCYENTNGANAWSAVNFSATLGFGGSYCTSRITGETEALGATSNDMRYGDGADQWFKSYILDGAVGPCVDSNSDGACDGGIDLWALEDERNGAGRFLIPMGLPVVTSFNSNFSASNILAYLFEIGPTSGITSTQLRDDIVNFDTSTIASEATGCGGMAVGGSYLDGSGAGVYALELLPCTNSAASYITIGDITVRALSTTVTPNIELSNPAGVNIDEIISVNAVTGQIVVNLRHDGFNVVSTPASIVQALNGDGDASCADGDASCLVSAFVSGDATQIQSSSAQTNFTVTSKSDAMVDVGFRCIVPITGYEE